jgi:hypothetical protein
LYSSYTDIQIRENNQPRYSDQQHAQQVHRDAW